MNNLSMVSSNLSSGFQEENAKCKSLRTNMTTTDEK